MISGPSGSGKTTLARRLLNLKDLKPKLVKSVSFTTRPKRSEEKGGRDYFFLSQKQFQEKLKAKKILEWTKYLGYYYATPRDFIEQELKKGKYPVLCLDLKGALKVRRLYPKNTVTIFILPPSLASLRQRVRQRCSKTRSEEIARRMRLAKRELSKAALYDYCVANKFLGLAVKELKKIILSKVNP